MRITIENLPPIASGSFEVRPLTIFIGPNNTGKSRAALLPYLFARSVELRTSFLFTSDHPNSIPIQKGITHSANRQLFETLRSDISEYLSASLDRTLLGRLRQYLKAEFDDETESDFAGPSVSFEVPRGLSVFTRELDPGRQSIEISPSLLEQATLAASDAGTAAGANHASAPSSEHVWSELKRCFGWPLGRAYYLPAERGALASFVTFYIDSVLGGTGSRESQELLPPAIRDFLRLLLRSASLDATQENASGASGLAVETLERQILKGRVAAAGNPTLPFPLVFSNVYGDGLNRFTIELSTASSSVAEVGPIAMILKSHVKPGDLVVIDEPETNLHPENQRLMAQALVRLAAAGVTVIATTHSSTIIHQVSNLVRAHELGEESRARLGWGKGDTLSHESVGVNLFKSGEQGVNISEIPFDEEYGYPEEEFYEVAERMVDETYRIDTVEAIAG